MDREDKGLVGLVVVCVTVVLLSLVGMIGWYMNISMSARVEVVKAGHTPAEAACLRP